MAQDWSYSQHSKDVALAGGVEQFNEKLISIGKILGEKKGKKEMIPAVIASAIGGAVLTAGGIIAYNKSKKYKKKKRELKLKENNVPQKNEEGEEKIFADEKDHDIISEG